MREIKLPNKRLGYYHINNKKYASVTTILQIIAKPALISWGIKQTAKAITENPNIIKNENDVMSAVYGKRDKASERGKTLHSLLEVLKNGNPLPEVPDNLKGYVHALQSWWNTHNPKILELEKLVYSEKYKYAGSCDLIAEIGNELYLCDLKTGKAIYEEYKLQISAYRQALIEMGIKIQKAGLILLKEDGNFQFTESEDCLKPFLHAKALWEWKNEPSNNK